jgi:protein kinase A
MMRSLSLNPSFASSETTTLIDDERAEYQRHTDDVEENRTKLEQLEFLTTVGTGTFGRVIVVKHKRTKDYYALKIMSIAEVLRLKQTDHVKNEKDILLQITHPFIINL